MIAVILAGGKGTRLLPLTRKTPKSLIKIGEKPIIEHQILFLKNSGIKEIWILLGYLGEKIRNYLETKNLKVKINFHQEKKLLGTAGALKFLEEKIRDDFLVLSGDLMVNFDLERFIKFHKKKKGLATLLVHPSDHPLDSDLVEVDKNGRIIKILKRPHPKNRIFRNLAIASIYIFSPKIFKYIPKNKKTDFEKDILPKLLKQKEKIFAYNTPEYIKDMGTPERLKKVRKDFFSGKIKRLNLKQKQIAVFLDRDGVINEEVDQLSKVKDLKLYPFSAKAIKKINELGYLTIIITNQPMIAKGLMREEDLEKIHKKLETELGKEGAKIDAIYYCPHHPEKGFKGERRELKIKCKCRKPEIGLFLKAKKDFNIDLKRSFLIGDKTSDILAGKRAGCKTILVKTGYEGKDGKYQAKPNFQVIDLLTSVNIIQKFLC